ncbi:MAG: hypothetical protein SFW66_04880 [Gammaproteobacteria bacterium]|nr:hypothetical protein [Gammaproteobacteria bacterium]
MNFKEILKALIYAAQNVTQIIPAQASTIFHYGTLADGRNICNYLGANICNNFYITDANNQTLGDGFYTIDGNFTWTPSQLNNTVFGTLLDTLYKGGESFDTSHNYICKDWIWDKGNYLYQIYFSGISVDACEDFVFSMYDKFLHKNAIASTTNKIIDTATSMALTATTFVETLYSASNEIFSFHFGSTADGFNMCKYIDSHWMYEYCQSFYITNFNSTPVSQGFFDIGLFSWPRSIGEIQSVYLNSLAHVLNTTNTTFSDAFQNVTCTTIFQAGGAESSLGWEWPSQIRFTGIPEWVCEKVQVAFKQDYMPPHVFPTLPPLPEEKIDYTPLVIFLAACTGGLVLLGLDKCIQQYMQNRNARQPLLPANNPHHFTYGSNSPVFDKDTRPSKVEEEKLVTRSRNF